MKKKLCIMVLGLIVLACKKTVTQPKSGIFRGVFEMTGTNGGGYETGDCTISLNDVTSVFALSVDTTATYPLASSGIYNIIDATKMSFSQNSGVDPMEFDIRHLYLDTTYNYNFDDNVFELKKQVDTILYEYRFVRY
jgi:hypothetical protein